MIRPGEAFIFAERFYSDSWKSTIAQRYGAQPEVLFYESPVIVENADENVVAQEVSSR